MKRTTKRGGLNAAAWFAGTSIHNHEAMQAPVGGFVEMDEEIFKSEMEWAIRCENRGDKIRGAHARAAAGAKFLRSLRGVR